MKDDNTAVREDLLRMAATWRRFADEHEDQPKPGKLTSDSPTLEWGDYPMIDVDKMPAEIMHLRTLVGMTTDRKALAEINTMIRELERRIHRTGNCAAAQAS
jgi:hypothetical protein